MASQQEVIKTFMASLDKTTLEGSQAVDEAIQACSDFSSTADLIAKLKSDYENYNDPEKFLLEKCGINLDNDDTGAITGSDAGGIEKNATDIVPNGTFDTNFNETSFTTEQGVTFQLAYQDDEGYRYPLYDFNELSDEEKHVWQGLYSFWAEESLKLIEESYGYSLTDSDSKIKQIRVFFVDDSSSSRYTAKAFNNIYDNSNGKYVYVGINMHYFKDIDQDDLDGKYPKWQDYYLDRLIAHELTHVVMNAKVNSFPELPAIITEGLAELTVGMDDSQDTNIKKAVSSKDMLEKLLVVQEDYNDVDGINNEDYVAGYILLRYLAKQASTPEAVGINVTNGNNNSVISGTAYADSVNNFGAKSTVNVGDDDDMVRNYSVASGTAINAGAGDDYLLNFADFVTINAGDGNDTINNSNSGYLDGGNFSSGNVANRVFISGGNGEDSIENSGSNVTISGGADDDTIKNYGTNVWIQYASGDGNDIIYGFKSNDTISLSGGTYIRSTVGSDVFINFVNGGAMTLDSASDKTINIVGGTQSITVESAKSVVNDNDGSIISGTTYNDTIYNYGENVTINTSGGNDYIYNQGGKNALINCGAGNDTINNNTYSDNVLIDGGAGDDYFIYNWGRNATLLGGEGNDTVTNYKNAYNSDGLVYSLGGANSKMDGGTGNDFLENTAEYVSMSGGAGADTIRTWGISNTINGGAGNDVISLESDSSLNLIKYNSGDGSDIIYGFNENSTLSIAGGTYTSTKSNSDLIFTVGNGKITLSGAANLSFVHIKGTKKSSTSITKTVTDSTKSPVTVGSSVKTINASSRTTAVKITGNKLDNTIKGGSNKDTIQGGSGNDYIVGNAGNDSLLGNAGNDTIIGNAGNDKLYGGAGADSILGGSGNDTLSGGDDNDKLYGNAGADSILGGSGNDTLSGGDDNDYLYGNAGADSILGGSGNDTLSGGDDNDYLYGNAGADSILGGSGNDTLSGGDDNDYLYGNAGADSILGGTGNDLIKGQAGTDKLYGNSGNDKIYGGDGKDSLWGGKGNDTLWGGDGSDMFTYQANGGKDYIMDYESGELLRIYNEAGTKRTSFSKSVFNDDTLTLTINGGGTVVFNDVDDDTKFNINGTSYKVSGSKLVKS